MAIARLIITADNKGALTAIAQTSEAADAASGEIIAADERTMAANEETTGSFADMHKGVSLLGTVAFAALAFGMDKSVKAALAWQSQQTSLQTALKNTGSYSKQAMSDINASIAHLATHGGFSESTQLSAITGLLTETGKYTEALKLNGAATNLARGAHISYQAAIKAVEGAVIGQGRALGKLVGYVAPVTKNTYGWTAAMKAALPDQYAQLEALNKQQTGVAILAAVHAKYSGQSGAYSRTIAGAWSNVSNSFEILLRQLGEMLLPVLATVAHVFSDIGNWMTSHMGIVKELAKQFLGVALSVGAIVSAYKAWQGAVKIMNALATTNPWLLAFMAIAAIAVEVVSHWKQVSGAVMGAFNAIGNAVTQVWDGLKRGFVAVVNFISGMINKFIIAPLNAVLSLGGLFGSGPVPTIPSIGGSAPARTWFGAGPSPQATQASNSGVPSNMHRAGDVATTIPVQVNIDGRVVAETVVQHIRKRVAMS